VVLAAVGVSIHQSIKSRVETYVYRSVVKHDDVSIHQSIKSRVETSSALLSLA